MQTIDARQLKKRCLTLLDSLQPEGILITKNGKVVAMLLPAKSDCAELIGSMKDTIKIHGDIFSTGERWKP